MGEGGIGRSWFGERGDVEKGVLDVLIEISKR